MSGDPVTVCSACKRASCWQGVFLCEEAQVAGTEDLDVQVLADLGLEHPDWWRNP